MKKRVERKFEVVKDGMGYPKGHKCYCHIDDIIEKHVKSGHWKEIKDEK